MQYKTGDTFLFDRDLYVLTIDRSQYHNMYILRITREIVNIPYCPKISLTEPDFLEYIRLGQLIYQYDTNLIYEDLLK